MLKQFLIQLKPMRVALFLFVLTTIILKPMAGAEVAYSGWQIVPTLLVPILVPIFLMLVLLDTLMAAVWKSESVGEEKSRYQLILRVNLLSAGLLLVVWIPFYIALGR